VVILGSVSQPTLGSVLPCGPSLVVSLGLPSVLRHAPMLPCAWPYACGLSQTCLLVEAGSCAAAYGSMAMTTIGPRPPARQALALTCGVQPVQSLGPASPPRCVLLLTCGILACLSAYIEHRCVTMGPMGCSGACAMYLLCMCAHSQEQEKRINSDSWLF
jgi:hypothetical protein